MHPKTNVCKVSLSIEFESRDTKLFSEGENFAWILRNGLCDDDAHVLSINIDKPTADFKSMLGKMSEEGCTQSFISHLKYAREVGAAWVTFNCVDRND